jgi:hypothetical protein
MKNWLLYRTHQADAGTADRFRYMCNSLRGVASLVWMHDADSRECSAFPGTLPDGSESFSNTDAGMAKIWPDVFSSYMQAPLSTPRVYPKGGGPIRPLKWTLGHLPALEWWISKGKPEGRFMVWEHDLWWDRDFAPGHSLLPAFSHRKFLAQPLKRYNPGPDTIQPPTVSAPPWLRDTMICHYTATVMSSCLMAALDEVSRMGCWGHCELLVPSVAHHHRHGGGAANWNSVARHPLLQHVIHRFEGQAKGKKPQRIFGR